MYGCPVRCKPFQCYPCDDLANIWLDRPVELCITESILDHEQGELPRHKVGSSCCAAPYANVDTFAQVPPGIYAGWLHSRHGTLPILLLHQI